MKLAFNLILIIIVALLLFFMLFGSVVVITEDMARGMGIEGATYLLVIRPSPFERIYVHVGSEMNNIVFGSFFNVLTFRGANVPWYADRGYLASHAFFAYNTKKGIILDPKFFEGKN